MSCVGVLVSKHTFPYARDVGSSHFIYLCYWAHVQITQIPDMLFHGDNWMGSQSTDLLKAGLSDPKTLRGTFWTDANWN